MRGIPIRIQKLSQTLIIVFLDTDYDLDPQSPVIFNIQTGEVEHTFHDYIRSVYT